MTRADKREAILEAAFHLFLTRGLSDTKMIDIAEEAGVGKGTIYEYFSSKDELFEILFERKVFSSYRDLEQVVKKQPTAKEKILAFLTYDLKVPEQLEVSQEVIYNLLISCGPGSKCSTPAKKCITQLMEYRFTQLYGIVSEGMKNGEFVSLDPLLATTSIMGALGFFQSFRCDLIEKITQGSKIFHRTEPWELEDFLCMLLHGLCSGKETACPCPLSIRNEK